MRVSKFEMKIIRTIMQFIPKKTNELTESEKQELLSNFNNIFKRDRRMDEFINQYVSNILGYSFHIIVKNQDRIIGHAAYVPAIYLINGVEKLFVDGIDGYIIKEFRDGTTLLEMIRANRENLIKNGVSLELGFPNTLAMKVYSKGKIYTKVGELNTYFLPYRIGGILKGLKFINIISILFSWLFVFYAFLFSSKKPVPYKIEKDADSYNITRYKSFDGNYSRIQINDFEFMFKIKVHEGIRTLFLIDVSEKSARNFNKAIKYILQNFRNEFDLLLYIGKLPFKFHGMLKMPRRFSPKEFNFAIKVLDKSLDKEILLNIENWDLNLSNFDLI
ncbi:hypothetical protein [Petrimonas sp.]|uniref:hypothetical protein n=1 Tax=Petrimonas sp. TaxID=2023866 RepID=UPI002FC634A5